MWGHINYVLGPPTPEYVVAKYEALSQYVLGEITAIFSRNGIPSSRISNTCIPEYKTAICEVPSLRSERSLHKINLANE